MRQAIKVARFEQFVLRPRLERFRMLQQAILACDNYDPWSTELHEMEAMFEHREYEAVLQFADDHARIWQLSPRFHFISGRTALELSDLKRADWEKRASRACLRQLLATGDGSRDTPFRITYISDENDILAALDVEPRCQQLVQRPTGPCDVKTLHDGTDIWFDVAPLFRHVRN
jgi:hypothetical protein